MGVKPKFFTIATVAPWESVWNVKVDERNLVAHVHQSTRSELQVSTFFLALHLKPFCAFFDGGK